MKRKNMENNRRAKFVVIFPVLCLQTILISGWVCKKRRRPHVTFDFVVDCDCDGGGGSGGVDGDQISWKYNWFVWSHANISSNYTVLQSKNLDALRKKS